MHRPRGGIFVQNVPVWGAVQCYCEMSWGEAQSPVRLSPIFSLGEPSMFAPPHRSYVRPACPRRFPSMAPTPTTTPSRFASGLRQRTPSPWSSKTGRPSPSQRPRAACLSGQPTRRPPARATGSGWTTMAHFPTRPRATSRRVCTARPRSSTRPHTTGATRTGRASPERISSCTSCTSAPLPRRAPSMRFASSSRTSGIWASRQSS